MNVYKLKVFGLLFCSILFYGELKCQTNYSTFDKLFVDFAEATTFSETQTLFKKLEQYNCMVGFYPTMAITGIEQGYRKEAIGYLNDALRYGYRVKDLEVRHFAAYQLFSKLTVDSLLLNIRYSQSIAFNWQAYLELNDYFIEIEKNKKLAHVDSNGRVLVIPLRNLMYQYIRKNGLPDDCEVGFGMRNKTLLAIITYSCYLHDFEFEELNTMLTKALNGYQITRAYYIYAVDYYFFRNGKTSKYGSLKVEDDADLISFVRSNLDEINESRKSIGLAKLEQSE